MRSITCPSIGLGTKSRPPTNGGHKVYRVSQPLFARVTPAGAEPVRKSNSLRLFGESRRRGRAWENANLKEATQ